MFRRLLTFFSLVMILAVVVSWVRSFTTPESVTLSLQSDTHLVARHMDGVFMLICQKADVILRMPHWLATGLLLMWPLAHLRFRVEEKKPDKKKR